MSTVDLLYFPDCPHVELARRRLAEALGTDGEWREWDLSTDSTPERLRGYGSPTVLVDGRDVSGAEPSRDAGLACRADGAPTVEDITRALSS